MAYSLRQPEVNRLIAQIFLFDPQRPNAKITQKDLEKIHQLYQRSHMSRRYTNRSDALKKITELINALIERKKTQLEPTGEITIEEIEKDDLDFPPPTQLKEEISLLQAWKTKPQLILERIITPPRIPLLCPRDIEPPLPARPASPRGPNSQ